MSLARRNEFAASLLRRGFSLFAILAFLVAGWASSAHIGAGGAHGECSSHRCGDSDHGDSDDDDSHHDEGECALCRVLARVPLVAALPTPLSAHEIVALASERQAPLAPPAAFLGFSLARGPPASSLA